MVGGGARCFPARRVSRPRTLHLVLALCAAATLAFLAGRESFAGAAPGTSAAPAAAPLLAGAAPGGGAGVGALPPAAGTVRASAAAKRRADLVIAAVSNPPAALVPGARFRVADTVRNRGRR